MNRTTLISAVVVAALAAIGVGYFAIGGNGVTPATASESTTATDGAEAPASEIVEMTLGNVDAPVKVVEYASYTCSHCASFHNNSFKELKAQYIDTGKVHFTYREVYFDRAALWASMVARCGGEEKFFGLTDLIYKGQSEWIGGGDPVAMADGLRKVGRVAGLSSEAIDACLEDEAKAASLVAWYQANAEADNISSTPNFIVNGNVRVEGNNPSRLREAIEAALGN